ncbi:MAG: DNA translocase FtsK [Bacilli bacterium]|jgi:S-DNA-T family DNA segregation ATPase FtsK/SpoIIIE
MAKRKKRKDEKEKNIPFSVELNGLLIILMAIIGIGGIERFGPMGNLIESFSMFLVGVWGKILLFIVLFIGGYATFKREWPKFLTNRLVGLYILAIAILMFSHIDYVIENKIKVVDIFNETINNFMLATKNPDVIQGGGIIGMLMALSFVKLFDINGAKIVGAFLAFFGFIMLTNLSPIESLKWLWNKIKGLFRWRKKLSKEVLEADDQYEKSDKVVISSMDELMEITDENKEERAPVSQPISPMPESSIASDSQYKLPPMNILDLPKRGQNNINQDWVNRNIEILETVLNDFKIVGKVVGVNVGPAVTQFEMELKAGTKVSHLLNINREISLALAARDVRIQAPIPGKNTVGIEIPNAETTIVTLREVLESLPPSFKNSKLVVALGKNIMGRPIFAEINNMPHLLVAGATGSGKSICINSIIASLLMRTRPDEVKLLLIDPKKVELSSFNGIPHLITSVVNDPKKAAIALQRVVGEMEKRYEMFNEVGVKNIVGYNAYIDNKNKALSPSERMKRMPYIIVIVDELADLMVVAAKGVEGSITRITQLARAAGIHLIVATQRPSTDVITGLIKANIPSRISFAVTSNVDSRTILDMSGAEKLLGKGDMLFLPIGENTPIRVQGAYVSDAEINRLINYVINQQKAEYDEQLTKLEEKQLSIETEKEEHDDPLYNEIVEFVIRNQKVSASLLQRKYRLGYNRAARIVDLLEERGIIGPANGSKPREVLVKLEENE